MGGASEFYGSEKVEVDYQKVREEREKLLEERRLLRHTLEEVPDEQEREVVAKLKQKAQQLKDLRKRRTEWRWSNRAGGAELDKICSWCFLKHQRLVPGRLYDPLPVFP